MPFDASPGVDFDQRAIRSRIGPGMMDRVRSHRLPDRLRTTREAVMQVLAR
jgi:hypothetical protein